VRTIRWRPLLVLILLATAFVLGHAGVLEWEGIYGHLEPISGKWWALPLLVILQAAMYALALPGSAFLVIAPLFYSPALSTAVVVVGGVFGAFLGYLLAFHLGADLTGDLRRRSAFRFLQRNSDFLTLCALRLLPGFPHAVINYGSGLLRLPLGSFLFASATGFAAKGYLYAVLVYHAVRADDLEDYIRLESIWPLFVLAALLVAGRLMRRRWYNE
jgi:uncharacterized membrane protein YdjX (TVP38/TMEM64 family)